MTRNSLIYRQGADEQGFVLVAALMFLVILTLVAITVTNTSLTESEIAANDKFRRQAFSLADGGTEVGHNLLEENISCPNGFTGTIPLSIGAAEVLTANFWINETEPPTPYPADANGKRHIRLPANDAVPHTNLHFMGRASLSTGSAIQMIAGYEGTGYSAATGGGQVITTVDSQHIRWPLNTSEAMIRIRWRHVIGHEGLCNY